MNPLFASYQKSRQSNAGQGMDLNSALQFLAQQIAPTGLTPEQIVRQLVQNDKMTQEQFSAFARIADSLVGGRR